MQMQQVGSYKLQCWLDDEKLDASDETTAQNMPFVSCTCGIVILGIRTATTLVQIMVKIILACYSSADGKDHHRILLGCEVPRPACKWFSSSVTLSLLRKIIPSSPCKVDVLVN